MTKFMINNRTDALKSDVNLLSGSFRGGRQTAKASFTLVSSRSRSLRNLQDVDVDGDSKDFDKAMTCMSVSLILIDSHLSWKPQVGTASSRFCSKKN